MEGSLFCFQEKDRGYYVYDGTGASPRIYEAKFFPSITAALDWLPTTMWERSAVVVVEYALRPVRRY